MVTEWSEFFLTVGGGAAALAGLVFVAMSFNLKTILQDPMHRARAVSTLTSFTATFIISALVLIPEQSLFVLGLEWLVFSSLSAYVYFRGLRPDVLRKIIAREWFIHIRIIGGILCYGAQILGSVLLMFSIIEGLYIAATAMVVYFIFTISAAWLLVVEAHQDEHKA